MKRILINLVPLVMLLLFGSSAQTTSDNTPEAANQMFAALAGQWSCSGSFADGRPLAADMTFTLESEGRTVRYHHRDRAPNSFEEDALWGPDAQNRSIVSLAFAGNAKTLVPELFVAMAWSASAITLEARPLTLPPFAPNRFTYRLHSPNSLSMIWEVQRNGNWSVGDQLTCAKQS